VRRFSNTWAMSPRTKLTKKRWFAAGRAVDKDLAGD
jgi:hypothetical protein